MNHISIAHRCMLTGSALLAVAATLATPAQASAGTATAPSETQSVDDGLSMADIVVTARRMEENIQTTPVAVTALGSGQLSQLQVTNQADLQRSAPGLVAQRGAPATSGFVYLSIRGQGNLNPGVTNDTAVGVYLDGVYIPRPSQGVVELEDIRRIEVLRGPQGTLFGRNTTGGALNMLTNDPDGTLSATVRAEYGNYDYWSGGAIVNVPLKGDELALRAVYKHSQHDGYVYNRFLNVDQNNSESDSGRIKLRFAPADSVISVLLSADYSHMTDKGVGNALAYYNPNGSPALPFSTAAIFAGFAPYVQNRNDYYASYGKGFANFSTYGAGRRPYDRLNAYGGSLTINVDLDNFAFKSISGYRYSKNIGIIDLDASPIDLIATETSFESRQISQEFQLSGNWGDRFNYIGGIYYSHETGVEFSNFATFAFLTPPGLSSRTALNDADVKNDSTGLYGQGYYDLTDRLRLAAGLRWTWDYRQVVIKNLAQVGLPGTTPIPAPASSTGFNCVNPNVTGNVTAAGICKLVRNANFNYPAYTLGLDFKVSDALFVYAKTSRASKSGGFNVRQGSENAPAFDPERAEDVELGIKYNHPSGLLRANLAGFHTWTKGVQRSILTVDPVTNNSTSYIVPAGNTRIYGGELELFVNPVQGLVLNGNVSYIHARYQAGTFTEQRPNGAGGFITVDRSGEPVSQVPEWQFAVGATYTVPVGPGRLALHADYAWIGDTYTNPFTASPGASAAALAFNDLANKLSKTPAYGLLNGRVGYTMDNGLELFVFGRNLTDKKYITNTFASLVGSLGVATNYPGDPRTYGVGLRFTFGK
ncbi:TonB-dependent receptor [Novosphingobium sp. BL-52-GroH]|uniref:TonB-dependent receptor n=1 Tax=Novosphingobium sp. BL-52-GroH TaxID=3349877 RepID=UPI0038501235